jgi:hypothetical protein
MPTIRTDSHRPKLPPEMTYPLGANDLELALEPHVTSDIFLSLHFHPQQSARKEDRDRAEALGEFRLLGCSYAQSGEHLASAERPAAPWKDVPSPQVIVAEVFALPLTALTKGVSLRQPASQLLVDALADVAARGIPSAGQSWLVEVSLDARVHTLRARFGPSGKDRSRPRVLELVLPPVGEKRRL